MGNRGRPSTGSRPWPKTMTDWYSQIEPEIRDLVRLLRNNGFNTTCSCGHEMTIDVDLLNNLDNAERLANFLQDQGIQNFKIEAELYAGNTLWTRRCTLKLVSVAPTPRRGIYE